VNAGELDEVKADPQAAAALKASHPRLDALQDQHGPMAGAIAPASTGTALSTSMIEVHLVCVAPSAGKKMGRQTKKVPGELMPDRPAEGLTVTNIIQLLDRISCAVLCCQQAQTLAQIPIECHQCQMPCVHLNE